jgi:hypothetical protein
MTKKTDKSKFFSTATNLLGTLVVTDIVNITARNNVCVVITFYGGLHRT